MKKYIALALACALLFACGCGCGAPEAGAETETTAQPAAEREAIEFPAAQTNPPQQQAKVSVTEIDMAAPENQAYRDWTETCEPPDSLSWMYHGNLPLPSTRRKTRPDDTAFKEWNGNAVWLKRAKESWETRDWNDDWELECYCKDDWTMRWDVLRARNKNTGEVQIIKEMFNNDFTDGCCSFPGLVSIVDGTHALYAVSGFEYYMFYLFTLGQGSVHLAGGDGYPKGGFSPDGYRLWIHSFDDPLFIYDLTTGDELYSGLLPKQYGNLVWTDNNTLYYYGKTDGQPWLYEVRILKSNS